MNTTEPVLNYSKEKAFVPLEACQTHDFGESPESRLWKHVVLQYFHDIDFCIRHLEKNLGIFKSKKPVIEREKAFDQFGKLFKSLRSMRDSANSAWFMAVCEFAETDHSLVVQSLNRRVRKATCLTI